MGKERRGAKGESVDGRRDGRSDVEMDGAVWGVERVRAGRGCVDVGSAEGGRVGKETWVDGWSVGWTTGIGAVADEGSSGFLREARDQCRRLCDGRPGTVSGIVTDRVEW